jgi:hypothetical protein
MIGNNSLCFPVSRIPLKANLDPDPCRDLPADPGIRLFTLMGFSFQILFLIKMMRICDFTADPEPAFHSNMIPGSGSCFPK